MSKDRVIVCEPRKDCADPHIHRWHCMRGFDLDDKRGEPGVCPLDVCVQRGANEPKSETETMPKMNPSKTWDPQRKQVKDALKAQSMSQAELARKLGITDKHMSQMLTGAADGRLDHWVAMAEVLGMTWQLSPVDPNDSIIRWGRERLGLEIEPWQAAIMRQHLAGFQ